jgi:tripartite-type tricarboxylate transporter receptor subunit TctC
MPIARRHFLRLAGAAVAWPALPRTARAWPARPLRFVVGFPPGGATDIIARVMGQSLSEHLGQPVVIENRPGGAARIAAESVASAAPDGHTLLLLPAANAVGAAMNEQFRSDFQRRIAPVAGLVRMPLVLETHPAFQARTVDELIIYPYRHADGIYMGSSGVGTTPHLAGELFKSMTGIEMTHVPYRGEPPAITDILGGRIQLMFGSITASIAHVRAGRLRAVAVTTASRSHALPDVPAMSESLPGYEVSTWFGVGVPRATPALVVDRLNAAINAGLREPAVQARLTELGAMPMPLAPDAFEAHVAAEVRRWSQLIRSMALSTG